MADALEVAAEVLGVDRVEQVAELGGSRRSVVRRIRAGTGTAIVKEYLEPEEKTWSREAAGLKAADGVRAPRLLGVREDPAVVVMSDLGPGPDVADALLGTDAVLGRDRILAWARAVGELQAHTADRLDVFREALASGVRTDLTVSQMDDLGSALATLCATNGLPWDDDVPDAIQDALTPLRTGPDLALTPSDTCPDNNLLGPDGLMLLDFEHAEIRHRAWEAAYLRVPWPSCWCAWQVPDGVSSLALQAYLDAAYGTVGPPSTFEADLEAATVLWCLLSVSWFLPASLDTDAAHNADDDRMPGRRTLTLARLGLAAGLSGPQPLVTWAEALHRELVGRWGDHPLRLAPAFR
ncbi:hypothetical protein [Nocardioides luteus]|uniref:hypothetical protein n=1 Tax=Nocardioides luteus TaxID=1844 RepID=UPI0018C95FE1|nr:hypothetical protein [Nocardioides luteus]MBG6097659.1 hypothetical protein [Nocardioides luteus]